MAVPAVLKRIPLLHLGQDVTFPLELALSSFGDYGQRGTGKTYTDGVLVEDMLQAGIQVVVIDPTDVWWGLRSSADGKSEGYPVYVFGGPHADVPLEEGAGELIADVLVDTGISAVLSLRHLRKGAQHRFFRAFAERFYWRKGEVDKRTPVHIVIDEAHSFAPSTVTGETAAMVGAVEDLVRLGRSSGIGCSLISQRPKAVNANVRTQAEALLCHRLLDKLDRDAVKEWVTGHDDGAHATEFMESLGGLKGGECWVWHPELDIFQRVKVRAKRTFDSSATPKIGEVRVEPQRLSRVDVAALGEQIASSLEAQKANDPRFLKAEIQRLTRELAASAEPPPDHPVFQHLRQLAQQDAQQIIEIDADRRQLRERLESALTSLHDQSAAIRGWAAHAVEVGEGLTTLGDLGFEREDALRAGLIVPAPAVRRTIERIPAPREQKPPPRERPAPAAVNEPASSVNDGGEGKPVKAGARRMLAVLVAVAQPLTRTQLGTLSNVASTGGTFTDYLSSLRQKGYISDVGSDVEATEAGYAAAGHVPPIGTAEDLKAAFARKLKAGARRMLDELCDIYPDAITRAELGERAGVASTGGTFTDYLSSLRRNGLLNEASGNIAAADVLFRFGGK